MPADPPWIDPKAEMLPQLCKEEGANLEPTFPVMNSSHIEMGRYVCWYIKTINVGQIQNIAG